MLQTLNVGDAVLVELSDGTDRIGEIKYIGIAQESDEKYIGLNLAEDVPNGHNGTIDGVEHFRATPGHGVILNIERIIQKLKPTDLVNKMQHIILSCKERFVDYNQAINDRDEYIKALKKEVRHLKDFIRTTKSPNSTINQNNHKNNESTLHTICEIPTPPPLCEHVYNVTGHRSRHRRHRAQRHNYSEYSKWYGKYDDVETESTTISSNEQSKQFPPLIELDPTSSNKSASTQIYHKSPQSRLSSGVKYDSCPLLCDSQSAPQPEIKDEKRPTLKLKIDVVPRAATKLNTGCSSKLIFCSAPNTPMAMHQMELPNAKGQFKHGTNNSSSSLSNHSIGSPIPEIRSSVFLKNRTTDCLSPSPTYNVSQNELVGIQSPGYHNSIYSPAYQMVQSPNGRGVSHGYETCVQQLYSNRAKHKRSSMNSNGSGGGQ